MPTVSMDVPFQKTSAWWTALVGALFALVSIVCAAVQIGERHHLIFVPALAVLGAYILWQAVFTLRQSQVSQATLRWFLLTMYGIGAAFTVALLAFSHGIKPPVMR